MCCDCSCACAYVANDVDCSKSFKSLLRKLDYGQSINGINVDVTILMMRRRRGSLSSPSGLYQSGFLAGCRV